MDTFSHNTVLVTYFLFKYFDKLTYIARNYAIT